MPRTSCTLVSMHFVVIILTCFVLMFDTSCSSKDRSRDPLNWWFYHTYNVISFHTQCITLMKWHIAWSGLFSPHRNVEVILLDKIRQIYFIVLSLVNWGFLCDKFIHPVSDFDNSWISVYVPEGKTPLCRCSWNPCFVFS